MRRLALVLPALLLAAPIGCVATDPVPPTRLSMARPDYHAPLTQRYKRVTPARRYRASRPPLRRYPSPSGTWYPRARKISSRWTTIVIHHSATPKGGAKAFDRYHREKNGWDELGYHFVIGNGTDTADGAIEVGPRWQKQKHGAHCKTRDNYYNKHGIGICLVGDFSRSNPTPRQLDSLHRLVVFLMRECGITTGRVTTHGLVTGKTQCPGPRFPVAWFRRALLGPMHASIMP